MCRDRILKSPGDVALEDGDRTGEVVNRNEVSDVLRRARQVDAVSLDEAVTGPVMGFGELSSKFT